jgi:hypothetical protein
MAFSLLSNHYHMIVRAECAKRLARFVGYFNSNLAREVSRLTGWTGKIWDRRYQAILISSEEEVQVARFRYVLAHGVKENLVAHLRQWPGLQSGSSRTASPSPAPGSTAPRSISPAAGRGRRSSLPRHPRDRDLLASPLLEAPLSGGLPATRRQHGRRDRGGRRRGQEADGTEPLGASAILAQDPVSRPKRLKKSPAPLLHVASKAMPIS